MKILVFGDSIGYGKGDKEGGWIARLRRYIDIHINVVQGQKYIEVYNQCIGGEVAVRMLDRFESELKNRVHDKELARANVVLLAVGVNDANPISYLGEGQSDKGMFSDALKTMIAVARNRGCEVGCIGLLPFDENYDLSWGRQGFTHVEVRRYDAMIQEVCKETGVKYLGLFDEAVASNLQYPDGIHPDSSGHEWIYIQVRDWLGDLGWI